MHLGSHTVLCGFESDAESVKGQTLTRTFQHKGPTFVQTLGGLKGLVNNNVERVWNKRQRALKRINPESVKAHEVIRLCAFRDLKNIRE